MSFDSSGQSFEIEDSADLDMSGGFASVVSRNNNVAAVEDDPWAMNLDIPTKNSKKKKKKKSSMDDDDEPPPWMRSSSDKSSSHNSKKKNKKSSKSKETALERAEKYLKKSKKEKKEKSSSKAIPETLSDMEFSSDEDDRRRRKKKDKKKSMRVNIPSTLRSGLSPSSDKADASPPPASSTLGGGGGGGGGMRRSTAQKDLGEGMGSSTLKRYQEELDQRNSSSSSSPLSLGQDLKDRVSRGRSEVVRSASDLTGDSSSSSSSNVVSSSMTKSSALGNVMSFADHFGGAAASSPVVKSDTPLPKSKRVSPKLSKRRTSPVTSSSSSSSSSTTSPTPTTTKNNFSTNEAFGNVMSFDALMGGSGVIEEDVVVEDVLVSEEEDVVASRRVGSNSTTRSEAFGNVRTMDDLLVDGGDSSSSNSNSNSNSNSSNRANKRMERNEKKKENNGKPPLHAFKNDPLEESIVEIVEEDDLLSSSLASSYSGKTPRAPHSKRPINIQDSVGSYMDEEFEDDEEYSVDFDTNNHGLSSSSSRVSPRAAKMQQQQHRVNTSTTDHRASKSIKKKSRTAGTQASGTKDVGCQAMLVPLPPLGYDPMLYFGSPAMMMGGGGMMRGGSMMSGMIPPSMTRMPPPGSFYGSYHHPAMRPMHAWSVGGSNHHSTAGSPGSSVAPGASGGGDRSSSPPAGSPMSTKDSSEEVSEEQKQTNGSSSAFGGDIFSTQMEASRRAFQNQLDTIRAHIQKTHARVAATAQAAGYQNYTTLASTQEYIAKMRKPQSINFTDSMSTVGTKYEAEL